MHLQTLLLTIFFFVASDAVAQAPFGVDGARTIDRYHAKQLYDEGALFIDVRSIHKWQLGHIKGALHLDLKERFRLLAQQELLLPSDRLVIYCNDITDLTSAIAVFLAINWGYTSVYYYREGYVSWLMEDYPVVLYPQTLAYQQ